MLKGTNVSSGIGIGNAVIVEEKELVIRREAVADAAAEVERFKGALDTTLKKTEELAADLATRVGEKEAEIMQGHMMLLMDPMLTGEIETAITGESICAEYAIEQVCTTYADMFASMDDELMQQRATDMRDIKERMQRELLGLESVDIAAASGRHHPGCEGSYPVHDSGDQTGQCSRYCHRTWRQDLPQCDPGPGAGDSCSSSSTGSDESGREWSCDRIRWKRRYRLCGSGPGCGR